MPRSAGTGTHPGGNVAPSSRCCAQSQLTASPSFLTFILGSALPPICHQHSPFIKPRASPASPHRHCVQKEPGTRACLPSAFLKPGRLQEL